MDYNIIQITEENKDIYAEDILNIKLRDIDKKEIEQFGIDSYTALYYSLSFKYLWVVENKHTHEIVSLFGLNVETPNEGNAFILSSEEVFKIKKTFNVYSLGIIEIFRDLVEKVCVIKPIETLDKKTLRWLNWLGFEITEILEFNNKRFYKFTLIKEKK